MSAGPAQGSHAVNLSKSKPSCECSEFYLGQMENQLKLSWIECVHACPYVTRACHSCNHRRRIPRPIAACENVQDRSEGGRGATPNYSLTNSLRGVSIWVCLALAVVLPVNFLHCVVNTLRLNDAMFFIMTSE